MISQLMVFMIRQSKSLHPSPFVSSPRHLASAAPPHSALFAVAVRPHQPPRNRRLSTSGPTCASAGSQASGPSNEEPLPFSEYTAEANSAYWTTRPVAVAKRLIQVTTALGSWLAVANFGGGGIEQRADKLRRILTTLGPAYVKIGQAVSSRPDVLPPEFLRELEKLQDRLPPFPTDQALAVIEAEYGRPASEVFAYISDTPVAAASLGQVFRATLMDGSDVAVKVQRPGVVSSISLDVLILRQLAGEVRRWGKLNTDLPALIDEWAASLFKELDYRAEAANGMKFKELYSHLEGVYVPTMHTALTTRRVLVMEWVQGERLRTAYAASGGGSTPPAASAAAARTLTAGSQDDLRLVEVGVRCSLEQLLEYGYYHADPHPGNLLRTEDGKLAYIDFGMMGEVDARIRRGLIRATLHLVNREYAALADDFVTLGMLPKDADKEAIVPALTGVFAQALAGGVNNLSFEDLSANLGRTMYQFKFQIPGYYTLLVRSLSVLEGIALASDPNYKVLGAAYPWVARRLLTNTPEELQPTLLSLLYKDGKFNFKRMESLLTQATSPPGRPQRPRDSPAGSEPPRGDALALVLSPQGEFVRGIIVDELAKGADAAWRLAADAAVHDAAGGLSGMANPNDLARTFPLLYTLLDVLEAVPKLADEGDAEQVEGMRRLAAALRESTSAKAEQQQERPAGVSAAAQSTWMPEFSSASSAGAGASDTGPQDACSAAMANLEAASALLQWALKEAETLGPEERAEALRLPLQVAQALASRVAARVIRWALANRTSAEEDSASGVGAETASPAATAAAAAAAAAAV